MTISSSNRKAGPFTGNGITTSFPFTFKVFQASDLKVVLADTATGVETVQSLTTNYTVSLNADQNTTPGGSVVMLTAPAAGFSLTLTSQVQPTQSVDLQNNGGFYPSVINTALDKMTILIQQVSEENSRTVKVPISSPDGPEDYMATIASSVAAAATSESAASASATASSSSAAASSTSASSAAASAQTAQTNADRAITAWNASTSPAETLAAISKTVHSGAIVKAIIYDTSKDSDGGAWRKRCTHTSWYNETLGGTTWLGQAATAAAGWALSGAVTGAYFQNTTDGKFYTLGASSPTVAEVFRGNVREFPAVVAVVAEASRVVIYDLTQVGTPMWRSITYRGVGGLGSVSSVAALNGVLLCGGTSSLGLIEWRFISDSSVIRQGGGLSIFAVPLTSIFQSSTAPYSVNTAVQIVNSNVNDIAATILPDAPTDPATGLPVPTIYAFTAGGVSRIAHDGTVSSTATNLSIAYGAIDGQFVTGSHTGGNHAAYPITSVLPAGGASELGTYWGWIFSGTWTSGRIPRTLQCGIATRKTVAGTTGVMPYVFNSANRGSSMSAAITTAYTSGWQVGDSRGAWLADTVAESITATEMAAATYATSPTYDNTTSTVSASSFTQTAGTTASRSYLNINTVVGKTYLVSYRLASISANNMQMFARDASNGGGASIATATLLTGAGQSTTLQFTATTTTSSILWVSSASAVSSSVDNISIQPADADRSVKANGLNIIGTLTKSAVASGAQLVGYSNFSIAGGTTGDFINALGTTQPIATGLFNSDFSVMFWWDSVADADFAISTVYAGSYPYTNQPASDGHYLQISGSPSAKSISLTKCVAGARSGLASIASFPVNAGLKHLAIVRRSGTLYAYLNGDQFATTSAVTADTTLDANGFWFALGYSAQKAALLRISATAPSADQIAHIYRTELPLFQAGAQCTIAGTSAAVTALAYDDATDLVHVGTSWGRSAFKDLTRVQSEATTTGALTALSAAKSAVFTAGTSGKYAQPAISFRDQLNKETGFAAKTNQPQAFSAPQRGIVTTDNDLSFDLSTTNNFKCTPAATGTLTFTNIASGQSGFILLVNSGGYTISAAATTKVPTGFLTAISAAGTYMLSYFSDGTNVYVVSSGGLA